MFTLFYSAHSFISIGSFQTLSSLPPLESWSTNMGVQSVETHFGTAAYDCNTKENGVSLANLTL